MIALGRRARSPTAAGARARRAARPRAARRARSIDTRAIEPGDLFVGLRGRARGRRARSRADALAAGAWGVLVAPEHAAGSPAAPCWPPTIRCSPLQRLATAWRRELDAAVIGVTGSVGKTSTKQLIAALVAPHRRVAANPANFNTEIGLPLAVLAAPEGTEVLVLEMGMRGFGQIDELARIAEPDVGVITNIGPVHLELVGDPGGRRAGQGRAAGARAGRGRPGRRAAARARTCATELDVVRFGTRRDPGGLRSAARDDRSRASCASSSRCRSPSRHQLVNLLAAVAAAQAVGVEPAGAVDVQLRRAARRAHRAAVGRRRHQRLLQRQPAVHARRARRSRHAGASRGGASPCSATCSSSGAGEAEAHREIGAYAASVRRRRAGRRRAAVGRRCRRRSAARRTSRPTRREAAALVAGARARRATSCW